MSTEKRKYELKARAERQEETRRRIVEATVELHGSVGPARTTIAEIARRAGVQRLTVYNHFPDDRALFAACSAHYMAAHPRPDLDDAFGIEDPLQRLAEVLSRMYGWYRENQRMFTNVRRDRTLSAATEERLRETVDRPIAELARGLAAGFDAAGARADRLQAMISLALDFATWQRLVAEGLDDAGAAEMMGEAVGALAGVPARNKTARRSTVGA